MLLRNALECFKSEPPDSIETILYEKSGVDYDYHFAKIDIQEFKDSRITNQPAMTTATGNKTTNFLKFALSRKTCRKSSSPTSFSFYS